ncbi:LOW QUALITY PROTEIN: Pentatricopeptide repeat [Dillenia turbinata]|uniref:Pentatricopeptide repeat n=1 Tax=Dillenia turbinata TaxID=194707 RepID=A0AAN8UTT0_9MAGN
MGQSCLRPLKTHPNIYSSLLHFSTTANAWNSCSVSKEAFTHLCFEGHLKQAFETFISAIWSDPSLFSHLLQQCIAKHSIFVGKQLHSLIISSGCGSDKFISNHLLNMYSKFGELGTAQRLFAEMPKKNIMSHNILLGGYIQKGDLDSARQLFERMSERNVATWNAMVTGMIQFEFNEEGLSLFLEMHDLGFLPDEFAVGSVLRGCAGLRALAAGQQIHVYVVKSGLEFNLVVGTSLAHMYMKCGNLGDGEKVIKTMPVHNVVACNTLIAGRAQNGCSEGALDQYNLMKMAGFRPDKITFVSVLSSCSELATLGQGQQIHAEVIKAGACSSISVVSSLISMYSRCGCLEDSINLFSECKDEDVVLWSSMIAAYGFHGRGKEAIELFEQMEEKAFEANDVTFLSLLYACSHCGLKDKGSDLFQLMVEKYGLQPKLEHYTCMVDLLGRCGCLEEAEALIRTMPLKADVIIWKTLLSACKIHKNADMARRIAEEITRLDPRDPASYVLLSNVHASTKQWKDVSDIRKSMRDNNVKKEPGISWLEVKNQVHQFSIGDQSHPKSKEIDEYLKELTLELKKLGYAPDIDSVLHDMEMEEQEYNVVHHSEKLAIAFALLSTPPGTRIRVMKNLRICTDCHVAIKLISKLKCREIVVRDASSIILKMGAVPVEIIVRKLMDPDKEIDANEEAIDRKIDPLWKLIGDGEVDKQLEKS